MNDRPRLVLDCNVVYQAITRPNGSSAGLIRRVFSGQVLIALSRPILRELRSTLKHPEVFRRYPVLSPDFVEEFLMRLRYRSLRPDPVPRYFSLPRDPRDEPYLDLAAAVQAEYLVSRDKDLLSLPTEPNELGNTFRRSFPRLSVLTPA